MQNIRVFFSGNNETVGPAVEAISKTVVEAGPGKCPFEDRHKFTTDRLNGKKFVMDFNILSLLNHYTDNQYI